MRTQCTIIAKSTQRRCKRTAMQGSHLCFAHDRKYHHPTAHNDRARDEGRNAWWRNIYPQYLLLGLGHVVQPGRPKGKHPKGVGRAYVLVAKQEALIMEEVEQSGGDLTKPVDEMTPVELLAAVNIAALRAIKQELDTLGECVEKAEDNAERIKASKARIDAALGTSRLQIRVDETLMRGAKKSEINRLIDAFREAQAKTIEQVKGKSSKDDF